MGAGAGIDDRRAATLRPASRRARAARRRASRLAAWPLFVLSLPVAFKAVLELWSADLGGLAAALAASALLFSAAMFARRGVQDEKDHRPFAQRRGLQKKRLAGVLLAIATAFTAFAVVGTNPFVALAYGVGAAAGFFMLYGWRAPEGSGASTTMHEGPAAKEANALLETAWTRLDHLESARARIVMPEFRDRLGAIGVEVGKILKAIEGDPENVRRARKFLNVYLDGAQKVAEQYARIEADGASPETEQNFRTLLVDMENTCFEQYEKLQKQEMLDLDVRIEVLSARLRREGVG